MILPFHLFHALPLDPKDGKATPVDTTHLDVSEFAPAGETEGTKKQVFGLHH